MKKKRLQELEWATAHFPVLGHDTRDCIVTHGQGGRAGAHSRRCDTALRRPAIRPARPTTRSARAQGLAAARARGQATGSVAIQSFVSWRRGSLCVATRVATRRRRAATRAAVPATQQIVHAAGN